MTLDRAALLDFCRWLADIDAAAWLAEQRRVREDDREQDNPPVIEEAPARAAR